MPIERRDHLFKIYQKWKSNMIKIEISSIVPAPPVPERLSSDAAPEEVNALFGRLRQLMKVCRFVNNNDRLNVLIAACIDEGINTGRRIVGVANRLDFDVTHARISLNKGIDDKWSRDENGTYRNLK